jgi:hypothetical protein
MKMFQLCKAKSGYMCNLEAYHGTYATDGEHHIIQRGQQTVIQVGFYIESPPTKVESMQYMWTDGFQIPGNLVIFGHPTATQLVP